LCPKIPKLLYGRKIYPLEQEVLTIRIAPTQTPAGSIRSQRLKRNRWLVAATLGLIVAAWLIGFWTSGLDYAPLALSVLPGAAKVEKRGSIYVGLSADGAKVVGYAAAGEAPGYAGPINMLVGIDPQGSIIGTRVVQQGETSSFFRLVSGSWLSEQFTHKSISDPLQIGQDLDAVSGATFSAEGVAAAIRQAVRSAAESGQIANVTLQEPPVRFGGPEIVVLLLYAAGYLGHRLRSGPAKKTLRWGTLLVGMIVLGFVYTLPLTITQIIALLSGYWPDWHNHLYWYFLIGGIVFVTTVDSKNPYCYWFCPFGAVQECLAALGGAKPVHSQKFGAWLKWGQRGLGLGAVLLGLALRRPGIAGYEPFATLFDLNWQDNLLQWIFLAAIVVSSVVAFRPFCNYLCPIDPVFEFIGECRKQVKEGWRKWRLSSSKN
jgi:NosR/NirI family transcriptional regulator, nitrous oxide reductase regulator